MLPVIIFFKQIENSIVLVFMYYSNREPIIVKNLSISLPYNYLRSIDNDGFSFTKYPSGDGYVHIKNNFEMSKDKFIQRYKSLLNKNDMKSYREEEIVIDNTAAYIICFRQSENSNIVDNYVNIPSRKILINYYGNINTWNEYFSVLSTIKFLSSNDKY